ncbi:MAG TPA: carboxypeptidase-like regulatory domain-containing protein [Bacteroidales bacterium]|nr:carboxypeptidase-like regulatory domain-containing protein [Bacteroidales bacterium]
MKRLGLLIVLFYTSTLTFGQTITVNGFVLDSVSKEPLFNAYLVDQKDNTVILTNERGFYNLSTKTGTVELKVSYVGYEPSFINITVNKDTSFNIFLAPLVLEEITIIANQEPLFKQALLGKTRIPVKEIQSIPSLAGEPDLLKSITHLPGVSGGREGYSDIYVRGGDRGQNLILFDGVKLYNTNHLGGLISLFNTDAVKSVDLYKGGFPAQFGGRASSVIDVQTREGNKTRFSGKYSIGILQSKIMLEGPLKSEKTSFLFALRGSYLDILTLPIRIKYNNGGISGMVGYTFVDLNLRINHQINNKRKFTLGIYSGHDLMSAEEKGKYDYTEDRMKIGNSAIYLEGTNILSSKLFLRSQLIYSSYRNRYLLSNELHTTLEDYQTMTENRSHIDEVAFKTQSTWYPTNRLKIKGGIDLSAYTFSPGEFSIKQYDYYNQLYFDTISGITNNLRSFESSVFVENDLEFSPRFNLYSGIRATYYTYNNHFDFSIEPRLSLRVLIADKLSAKASFTKMTQNNLALVSNYQGFEREVWIPATDSLPRQIAYQYSFGLFGEVDKINLEFGLEAYYKQLSELYYFRSPTGVFEDFSQLSNYIVTGGRGKSIGAEFTAIYNTPHLSVSLAYTLSKSTRQFIHINNNEIFPSDFDRRHDLSIVTRYRISKRYTLNTNFIFSSGTPFTFPESYTPVNQFYYGYFNYNRINNVTLPDYHRLDLGLERHGMTKNGRKKKFLFNIYNVYARQNPVYIYQNPDNGKTYQKSMFSILPTISYSVEF